MGRWAIQATKSNCRVNSSLAWAMLKGYGIGNCGHGRAEKLLAV